MCDAVSVDVGNADVHGARTILGEDGLVAASADIERRSKVAMAPVTVSVMTMTMTVTVMAVTVATMATMAAMTTVPAAGGRRCDRSRAHGNGGDGSKGNFTQHSGSPSGHDCPSCV